MYKISCIIPVFNVELFLEECVESVLNQTFRDFELILVDDGSTDNSGKLCDRLAELDSRIKVFHQQNKGASSARNNGIKNSKGEYICFIDSDDKVSNNYFEIMFNTAVRTKTDMVVCGYQQEVPAADDVIEVRDIACVSQDEDEVLYSRQEFFDAFPKLRADNNMQLALQSPCMRLIKKRDDFPLFDERTVYGEDDIFNICLYKVLDSICYIKPLMYFYRYNGSSVTKKIPVDRVSDGLLVVKKNLELFSKFCKPQDMKYFRIYNKSCLFKLSLMIIKNYGMIGKYDAGKMFKLIRNNLSYKVVFSNIGRIKESIFLFFVKLGLEKGNGIFSKYLTYKVSK